MTLEEKMGESIWNSYRNMAYLLLEEKKPGSGPHYSGQEGTRWARFRQSLGALLGRIIRRNGNSSQIRSQPGAV